MIQLCGYNLCHDINALDVMPAVVDDINNVTLQSGIYYHMDITHNTDDHDMTTIPVWDLDTILDCDFNNNISAGNIKFSLSTLDAVKIKRREKGSFDWITLEQIEINNADDFMFMTKDYYATNNTEYEYAIVPIIQGVESDVYITNDILSKFNGIFITDGEQTFKLLNGVIYENQESSYATNIYKPIGSKYPVVIANGNNDYMQGAIDFQALGYNFEDTRTIDKISAKQQVSDFIKFMKNGKNKLLKDWNGNIYILALSGSINVSENVGSGLRTVSFSWVEQGDPNNQLDLYINGLVNIAN